MRLRRVCTLLLEVRSIDDVRMSSLYGGSIFFNPAFSRIDLLSFQRGECPTALYALSCMHGWVGVRKNDQKLRYIRQATTSVLCAWYDHTNASLYYFHAKRENRTIDPRIALLGSKKVCLRACVGIEPLLHAQHTG